MTSRKPNHSRTLSFQTLENRSLMAGNVTGAVTNHSLTLTGDAKDNNIQIAQVGNHDFKVTGQNGTKINGHNSQTFHNVTGDFNINFKDGNDTLALGDASILTGQSKFVEIQGNLSVNMGNGANSFSMTGTIVDGKASLTAGTGNDTVNILYGVVGGDYTVPGKNDFTINLGAGNNKLTAFQLGVNRDLNILDHNSQGDTIAMNAVFLGRHLYLETGNGNDSVQLDGVQSTTGDVIVNTYGGNDKVFLGGHDIYDNSFSDEPTGIYADEVLVDLGDGNDWLQYGGSSNDPYGSKGGVTANYASYNGGSGANVIDYCVNHGINDFTHESTGFDLEVFGMPVNEPHPVAPILAWT